MESESVRNFLDAIGSAESDLIDDISNFIGNDKIMEAHKKIVEIKETYIDPWDKRFNIFKIISPTFYERENLHSQILQSILDPQTLEIGDIYYLNIFQNVLMEINKNIKIHDFSNESKVECETGKIDILIHDETHAIIIENKINNASDMPNQLARYYEYVKGMNDGKGKEVVAVVYLPLDPGKHPPLNEYQGIYKTMVEDIKQRLVTLPAISSDGKNDLVHGFIFF